MGGKHDSPASGDDPPSDEAAGARSPFPEGSPAGLTNHLLIAMPQLSDPNFAQTVALICEHTDKGALGIVLNKPLPMKLSDVLSQMKLEPTSADIAAQPVLRGGPVHTDRGFVLHRPGGQWDHTHRVSAGLQPRRQRVEDGPDVAVPGRMTEDHEHLHCHCALPEVIYSPKWMNIRPSTTPSSPWRTPPGGQSCSACRPARRGSPILPHLFRSR